MHKFFAVFLSLSLLLPHTLWAHAKQTPKEPNTLAEYQQRAQEDIQKAPWISKEGKIVLAPTYDNGNASGFIVDGKHVTIEDILGLTKQ